MTKLKTLLTHSAIEAADFIKRGGIVAFPTETVYGLGANVFDENAIAKIYKAKQRPADNPLIAHVSSFEQIGHLTTEITKGGERLIKQFFPGPLTVVLSKSGRVPEIATAGLDSIGIRMPRHEGAREFLKACGVPLVAPSANLSGRPSPTTWQAVYEDMYGRIDCILQGKPTEIGLESTVVDCRGEIPMILRLGGISLDEIRSVLPDATLLDNEAIAEARSPGLRHKHYAPQARVFIYSEIEAFDREKPDAFIGVTDQKRRFDQRFLAKDTDAYAQALFEFFRECDRRQIKTIYCESVDEEGLGAALMDRIRRASEAGR